MKSMDDILNADDLFDDGEGLCAFERPSITDDRLFWQIRVNLVMKVHKVTEDVAVMMMKAHDTPKKRGR